MKIALLAVVTILLTGCTYTDECSENKLLYGYTEDKIDNSNYRVRFRNKASESGDASNFALLKAAKLTQIQGYDWFEVTKKKVFVNPKLDECGLITRSKTEGLSIKSSNEIYTLIAIKMGKGIKTKVTSYDAQGVINDLASNME